MDHNQLVTSTSPVTHQPSPSPVVPTTLVYNRAMYDSHFVEEVAPMQMAVVVEKVGEEKEEEGVAGSAEQDVMEEKAETGESCVDGPAHREHQEQEESVEEKGNVNSINDKEEEVEGQKHHQDAEEGGSGTSAGTVSNDASNPLSFSELVGATTTTTDGGDAAVTTSEKNEEELGDERIKSSDNTPAPSSFASSPVSSNKSSGGFPMTDDLPHYLRKEKSATPSSSAPNNNNSNNNQALVQQARLNNLGLLSYIIAMKFFAARNEKPILDAYWVATGATAEGPPVNNGDTNRSNTNNKKGGDRKGFGFGSNGISPSNAAHLRREGITAVTPRGNSKNGGNDGNKLKPGSGLAGLTANEVLMMEAWEYVPIFLRSSRPTQRYHRFLTSQDRELHHILAHFHLEKAGSTPLAYVALGMLSNQLRSQGSIFGKGGSQVGNDTTRSVGHVWITMPIVSSMYKELKALVNGVRNKRGPLYAAIEAQRESMISMQSNVKPSIEVSFVDFNRLKKLSEQAAGKLYFKLPKDRNAEDLKTTAGDCEENVFMLISCMSGSHTVKKVAQESAAIVVLRLAIEIFLEGMTAGALMKDLVVGRNASPAQIEVARKLREDQIRMYCSAITNSEENYLSSERFWRYPVGKKKIIAASESHRKALRAVAGVNNTAVAPPPVGSKRDRDMPPTPAAAPRGANTQDVISYAPHQGAGSPHNPLGITSVYRAPDVTEQQRISASPYPSYPHLPEQQPGTYHPYQQPQGNNYHSQPPPVYHPQQHLDVTSAPTRMTSTTRAPIQSIVAQPAAPPSRVELGNNCDFTLPDHGFVSPRHRLDAFDEIAKLTVKQRNALLTNIHSRVVAAIALWPKSTEELRVADTFHLLQTIVDALGGYGQLEYEVVQEEDGSGAAGGINGGLYLPSFSSITPPPPLITKYRATISLILIAPANVMGYGPQQHTTLLEMLRTQGGVDKSRIQEPMLQLMCSSGEVAVADAGDARKLAAAAMIDQLSSTIGTLYGFFKSRSAAA